MLAALALAKAIMFRECFYVLFFRHQIFRRCSTDIYEICHMAWLLRQ